MTVPNKKLIFGVTAILVSGASFTLAHHLDTTPNPHASTSTQLNSHEPGINAQGVTENPPVSVNVDGKEMSVAQGTTRIPTNNGTATVTVLGENVHVEQIQSQPGSSSISVHSSNTGGASSISSFQSSASSVNSSSSSQTSISSSGNSSVNIQTNP